MKLRPLTLQYWAIPGVKKETMPKLKHSNSVPIPAHDIIKMVCEYYNLEFDKVTSKDRSRYVCYPRHILMLLLYTYCDRSLKTTGDILNRDHTTVLHGIRTIQNLTETDDVIRAEVDMFKFKIFLNRHPGRDVNEPDIF